jgi:hypothetical protein
MFLEPSSTHSPDPRPSNRESMHNLQPDKLAGHKRAAREGRKKPRCRAAQTRDRRVPTEER